MVTTLFKGNDEECRKLVKGALESLRDTRKLGQHELAGLQLVEWWRTQKGYSESITGYGLALREVLREAVEKLKPDGPEPDPPTEPWRPYVILDQRYWHSSSMKFIGARLGLAHGRRQQEYKKALDRLCDELRVWEEKIGAISRAPRILSPQAPVFMAPPPSPYPIVGRDELLGELKKQLLLGGSVGFFAMTGLPGVGKTTLVIELAYDAEVRSHFNGGVLWAGLGQQPDLAALLASWGVALGISASRLARFRTERQLAEAINTAIGLRQMLIVIDDAWQAKAALMFRIGGPNCVRLLTTRHRDIALDFAGSKDAVISLSELTEEEGSALLKEIAPDAVSLEPDAAHELVRSVGGLPLAIMLMGRYLLKEGAYEQPQRIRHALQQLRRTEYRLQLVQPVAPLDNQYSFAEHVPLSLQAVIGLSDNILDQTTRQALRALSVFPPKPNTFPREAALAVAAEGQNALNHLADAGLLECSGQDRYMVHQVIADYAKARVTDMSGYARMVDFYVGYVQLHQRDYEALEQERSNLLLALEEADKRKMQQAFVQGINLFYDFLEVRGLYDLAEPLLKKAETVASASENTLGLVTTWLNLGRINDKRSQFDEAITYLQKGLLLATESGYRQQRSALLQMLGVVTEKGGDYTQAEAYYQEGLSLAQTLGNHQRVIALLANLGIVVKGRGEYERAEEYYQEALVLARQVEDHDKISFLLLNMGVVASSRGYDRQAEAYYREALDYAQQLNHPERISRLLANLSAVLMRRGAYQEAEAYLQEGLKRASEIKHRERMSHLLLNLGEVLWERGAYNDAEAYLQQGMTLAQEIGHRWMTSAGFIQCGELALTQRHWQQAASHFQQALEITREIGTQDLQARALFGLAQATFAKGTCSQEALAEARELAEESLSIFEKIGNERRVKSVRKWLGK